MPDGGYDLACIGFDETCTAAADQRTLSSRAGIQEAAPVTCGSVWVGVDKCSYRTQRTKMPGPGVSVPLSSTLTGEWCWHRP